MNSKVVKCIKCKSTAIADSGNEYFCTDCGIFFNIHEYISTEHTKSLEQTLYEELNPPKIDEVKEELKQVKPHNNTKHENPRIQAILEIKNEFHTAEEELAKCGLGHSLRRHKNGDDPLPLDTFLEILRYEGLAIQYITNPSKRMKHLAVQSNPLAILAIDRPSLELKKQAVYAYPKLVVVLEDETTYLGDIAVIRNPEAIKWITESTVGQQVVAVSQKPEVIKWIDEPEEEAQMVAVIKQPETFNLLKQKHKELWKIYKIFSTKY